MQRIAVYLPERMFFCLMFQIIQKAFPWYDIIIFHHNNDCKTRWSYMSYRKDIVQLFKKIVFQSVPT